MQEADRLRLRHFLQTAHKIQWRALERQRFLLLCVIARHDTGPDLDGAGRGGDQVHHRPEQRGLATAVGPYDAHTFAIEQCKIEWLKKHAPTDGLAQPLDFQDFFAAAVRVQVDFDFVALQYRTVDGLLPGFLHTLRHILSPASKFGVQFRPPFELAHTGLQALDLGLLQCVQFLQLQEPLLPFGEVETVVASVLGDGTIF